VVSTNPIFNPYPSIVSIYISVYDSTVLLLNLGHFYSFLILYTVGPSQGRYLHTEQHNQNKRTQIFMARVGFEPTVQALEREKTVHLRGYWRRCRCRCQCCAPRLLFVPVLRGDSLAEAALRRSTVPRPGSSGCDLVCFIDRAETV
jgi:hypothetical protein